MYLEKRASQSQFVALRGQRYHVLTWGQAKAGQTPLVMVHGWMDVAASFQFVIDAFVAERQVIAPDWRGYGLTDWGRSDNYWFPDYLADLDFLIDQFAPDQPIDLAGHSMGGNVVTLYAGIRPERIRRLINLEGFGVPATEPSQAPKRYAQWMDQLKAYHRGKLALRSYDSLDGVARRLMKTNARLSEDKANWLARHWSRQNAEGQWEILGDAAHKIVNAQLTRLDETLEIYRRISAPYLMVEAEHNLMDTWYRGRYALSEFHERLKNVPQASRVTVADAGHMLHHDQPERLAALIEDFLA